MRVLLAILLLAPGARAAGPWLRITSPHFELFTTAGERRGRDAVLQLERVRGFLTEVFGRNPGAVRVVAFTRRRNLSPIA